ncbi:MAG TPA: hypothetical protein VE866_04825 [Candidatus Binatia bacterium]|nr:hypothetical protein [Candidatus Binatia bacterium]
MSNPKSLVDCIYIAACARDARLTRICVASIRYFYPDIPIRLLAGEPLQRGLASELRRYWGVELVDLPEGDYGPGFVKLEPLFGRQGESFLLIDVDTAFSGPVLDLRAETDAPFIVDKEELPDADSKRLYYDWDKLREIDPQVQPARSAFNTGQWFATAGALKREDFDPWVEWTMPRCLRHPGAFMVGDQGVMNYVILQKEAIAGLRVARRAIMRWPGHSMEGLNAESIGKRTAPPQVIHWAGMKKTALRQMVGSDILQFFERFYYTRFPAGTLRRWFAICQHFWIHWLYWVSVRVKLSYRRMQAAIRH